MQGKRQASKRQASQETGKPRDRPGKRQASQETGKPRDVLGKRWARKAMGKGKRQARKRKAMGEERSVKSLGFSISQQLNKGVLEVISWPESQN